MIIETFHIVWGNRQTDSHFLIILVELFYHIVFSRKCSWKILSFSLTQKCRLLMKMMRKLQWKARANWSMRGKLFEREFFFETRLETKQDKSCNNCAFFMREYAIKALIIIMWLYSHFHFVARHLSWIKFIQSPVKMTMTYD